jgi:hypothetical protein
MSALGFLGGLSSVAAGFQKGYEQSEDREQLKKDRDFQRQQREFEVGQQTRKLAEQSREEKARNDYGAVATTEQIDDPNWKPAPVSANPVAQVSIGDDGSETVTPAQEPQQAPKITRQRSRDAIFRDYAAIARKSGKLDTAIELETKADKMAFERAAKDFTMWSSSSKGAPLDKAAESFAQIYSADPFGGRATVVKNEDGSTLSKDGSVTVEFVNKDNGFKTRETFKSVADLVNTGRAYYQPETFNALLKAQQEAALKANEPKVVNPGGALVAGGKEVYKNTTDRVQIGEDADGNPIYGKPATGTRSAGTSGKAPKESIDAATELLKDFLGKADGSPEGAQRQARAVSLLDGIYSGNPGVSPRTAAAIAADASADPTRVSLQIDNRTGLIGKVYSNPDLDGGRQYNLAPNGAQVAEMEKAVGKQGMVQSVSGMLDTIAAGAPEENRAAVREQFIAVASNPTARAEFLAAAKAAGRDPQALTRQLDLVKTYMPAPKTEKGPAITAPAGMRQQPVDPASPAGRSQARQAELRAEAGRRDQERMAAQQALSKQFQADKASMDPLALAQKYDSMRGQLPTADAAELQRIERNIR